MDKYLLIFVIISLYLQTTDQLISFRNDQDSSIFNRYLNLNEIYHYLEILAINYTDKVIIEEIGRTYEGRPIKLVCIKSSINGGPSIWIDGGIHPREWISISTALYLIKQLINGNGINDDHPIIGRYNWYILPVVNPDGYEYTWTTDRLWRKNRSQNRFNFNIDPKCRGVDLNRNFHFYSNGPENTLNPCSEKYRGPNEFSEAETRAVINRLVALRSKLIAFITLHSYDQLWMIPSLFLMKPKHYQKMMGVARAATEAIKIVSGRNYRIGSINQLSDGFVGGGSVDWVYKQLLVNYSFALELRDKGRFGFILPPNQIVPTGNEIWVAVKSILSLIINE